MYRSADHREYLYIGSYAGILVYINLYNQHAISCDATNNQCLGDFAYTQNKTHKLVTHRERDLLQ